MNDQKTPLKDFILNCLDEKKAENINCMKLEGEVPLADYIIFASGRSTKNIQAIGEYIALQLKHELKCNASIEGLKGSDWILVDAGDVIVHLFHPETRENLKLEELFSKKS